MATIGSLAVNIVAKTDKFISGLNSARTSLTKFTSGISAVQGAIGALSAYGLGSMVKEVIDAGDAVYDLSAKLGIGTMQLGALQFAAGQMGASSESLTKGLQILNKQIGMMQQGSKPAIEAFERLGIKANDIVNLSLDQKFMLVSDAINKLGTETEQAAAAQQIFGKGGQELLPIIREGNAALLEMGDTFAKTGMGFTDAQAAQMNAASDAIKTMAASWQGLKIELITGYIPAITQALEITTTVMQKMRSFQDAQQSSYLDMLEKKGFDVTEDRKKLQSRTSAASGGNPLAAPNGKPVPVNIVKDSTSNGDTVQLGTVGIR